MSHSPFLSVAVWCPSFKDQDGGVQQFSRLLCQALEASRFIRRVRVNSLFPSKGKKFLFILQVCWDIVMHRPDLVVITHLHLARLAFMLRLLKIPYWICAHGVECWQFTPGNSSQDLLLAGRILCVSRYTRDQLQSQYPAHPLPTVVFPNHVIPPTVRTVGKKEARRLLNVVLEENTFVVLTVSRLDSGERYKGHRLMFDAINVMLKRGEKIHYMIVGEGDDRTSLEALAQAMNLDSSVRFLGRLDEAGLDLAYRACDAFAMPSTGEGFGIVYLEALVRDRPVLAGNRDGSTDPLDDGALGVLVDPLDLHSLVDGLGRLRSVSLKTKPGELSEAVLEKFGFAKLQERLDALLQTPLQTSCAE